MKHHHPHTHANRAGPPLPLQPVRFEFTDLTAASVCVAGTFNDWHPEAKPMHVLGEGHWLKETKLAPGTYEYCLVVDGRYIPDPLAGESVPNPFGGRNSILKVLATAEATHLANAEHTRLQNPN